MIKVRDFLIGTCAAALLAAAVTLLWRVRAAAENLDQPPPAIDLPARPAPSPPASGPGPGPAPHAPSPPVMRPAPLPAPAIKPAPLSAPATKPPPPPSSLPPKAMMIDKSPQVPFAALGVVKAIAPPANLDDDGAAPTQRLAEQIRAGDLKAAGSPEAQAQMIEQRKLAAEERQARALAKRIETAGQRANGEAEATRDREVLDHLRGSINERRGKLGMPGFDDSSQQ